VRVKCTTGVDVYMVTELLDLGEMRLRGVLFFSFLVLERELFAKQPKSNDVLEHTFLARKHVEF
jgi:hypothetical protein